MSNMSFYVKGSDTATCKRGLYLKHQDNFRRMPFLTPIMSQIGISRDHMQVTHVVIALTIKP